MEPKADEAELAKFIAATGLEPAVWLEAFAAGRIPRGASRLQFKAVAERLVAPPIVYPVSKGAVNHPSGASKEGPKHLAEAVKRKKGGPQPGSGRPTHLTDEVSAGICRVIAQGNYRDVAGALHGIDPTRLSNWFGRGAREKKRKNREASPYRRFYEAVLAAEATADIAMVQIIVEAAAEDPRHAQFFLSRKHPERWSRRDNVVVTGANGGPVEVNVAHELLARKIASLFPANIVPPTPPADVRQPDADAPAAAPAPAADPGAAPGGVDGPA